MIAVAIVIGLLGYAIVKMFEAVGWVIPILLIIASIGLVVWYQIDKAKKRLAYLRGKYHDEELVQQIYQGEFWQGQSEEQLRDALGPPVDVDQKLLKTKTKEVWKYDHRGGNRFGLRVIVENDYVVGWDQKS
jgi:hypothetical protein